MTHWSSAAGEAPSTSRAGDYWGGPVTLVGTVRALGRVGTDGGVTFRGRGCHRLFVFFVYRRYSGSRLEFPYSTPPPTGRPLPRTTIADCSAALILGSSCGISASNLAIGVVLSRLAAVWVCTIRSVRPVVAQSAMSFRTSLSFHPGWSYWFCRYSFTG